MSHFKEMFERETFSNLDIAFLVRLFHKKHNWCCDILNTYKYLVHDCIIFVLYIMKSIIEARISDLVMQLNSNRNLVCFEHTDPLFYFIFLFTHTFTLYNVFYQSQYAFVRFVNCIPTDYQYLSITYVIYQLRGNRTYSATYSGFIQDKDFKREDEFI